MTVRRHLLTLLSATLFVAATAFAASAPTAPTNPLLPPPAPTNPPIAAPLPPTPTSTPTPTPTVLWVYGYPSPAWEIVGDFDQADACAKILLTIKPTLGQEARCFRVGVDPARLHEEYGVFAAPAPTPVNAAVP